MVTQVSPPTQAPERPPVPPPPDSSTVGAVAHRALTSGISVVPPMEDGSKRPLTNWKFFQQNLPTAGRMRRWYADGRRTGLGFVCGAVSGNLEVIEPDEAGVAEAVIERAHAVGLGELLDRIRIGYEESSPGGGRHWAYYCETIDGNTHLARRVDADGQIHVLIETRGEGGYIVAAPSNGRVHPSGGAYVLIRGGVETIATITPAERADLWGLARSFDEMPPEDVREPAPNGDATGDRPGDDYNARGDLPGLLERHGWVRVGSRGVVSFWRRPGKDRGISATYNHGGRGLFHVFSTSTAFEGGKSVRPFTVYATLECGGDFPAAARALRLEGYGSERPAGTTFTVHGAKSDGDAGEDPAVGLDLTDFAAYLPDGKYIYRPTGKIWDVSGINRAFPPIGSGKDAIKQSTTIDHQCPVHDLTWMPGRPQIIEGVFLDQGGWIEKPGARVYNSYRPPHSTDGCPAKAGRWIDHVRAVYPDGANHIVTWLAHRVQRPGEKVNHALVLGGAQGIGKDTILEPVRHAVGPWNVGDVSPIELIGRFNAFLKAVILRVSELRDLGDRDRFGFYEHTKTLISAPPDTMLIDEKNVRAYRVPNLVGVVFTTNHRTDGLYLPADDRRHYVAWSDLTPDDFPEGYWRDLYRWFEDDGEGGRGDAHVAAYLANHDMTGFDPKAPPPKTAAFWDVVAASRAPEDGAFADALASLDEPDAVTVGDLEKASADFDFRAWLVDRRNARQLPHRFESAGYVAARNPNAQSGLWVVAKKRQVVYVKREFPIRERIEAARKRTDRSW